MRSWGWGSHNRVRPCEDPGRRLPSASQEVSPCQEPDHADTLILDFPTSRTAIKSVVQKPRRLGYFIITSQTRTTSLIHRLSHSSGQLSHTLSSLHIPNKLFHLSRWSSFLFQEENRSKQEKWSSALSIIFTPSHSLPSAYYCTETTQNLRLTLPLCILVLSLWLCA